VTINRNNKINFVFITKMMLFRLKLDLMKLFQFVNRTLPDIKRVYPFDI
jgi:hypothetical protein